MGQGSGPGLPRAPRVPLRLLLSRLSLDVLGASLQAAGLGRACKAGGHLVAARETAGQSPCPPRRRGNGSPGALGDPHQSRVRAPPQAQLCGGASREPPPARAGPPRAGRRAPPGSRALHLCECGVGWGLFPLALPCFIATSFLVSTLGGLGNRGAPPGPRPAGQAQRAGRGHRWPPWSRSSALTPVRGWFQPRPLLSVCGTRSFHVSDLVSSSVKWGRQRHPWQGFHAGGGDKVSEGCKLQNHTGRRRSGPGVAELGAGEPWGIEVGGGGVRLLGLAWAMLLWVCDRT